jgi:hypothetical protein
MPIISGSRQDALMLKDVRTKASIADLETKAAAQYRSRDIKGALSDSTVARRIRNEAIAGIFALILIGVFTYWFFFVFLD